MVGIEIATDPGGLKEGIVMDVAEIEDAIFDEIYGAGVGPGQAAGLEEDLIEQGVEIFDAGQAFHDLEDAVADIEVAMSFPAPGVTWRRCGIGAHEQLLGAGGRREGRRITG
jgi:hypothetical protein